MIIKKRVKTICAVVFDQMFSSNEFIVPIGNKLDINKIIVMIFFSHRTTKNSISISNTNVEKSCFCAAM